MTEDGGAAPGLPSAAFLDRDGTIIRDTGYLSDPDRVELLPGAARAIRRLNDAGVPVIVVTNQSGIGRGYYEEAEFLAVQARVERCLARVGARVDACYHCPHTPETGCSCRKPGLEMYERAASEMGVDISRAAYVGDRASDVQPALSTGGFPLLVAKGDGEYDQLAPPESTRVPDLAAAVTWILGHPERTSNSR